ALLVLSAFSCVHLRPFLLLHGHEGRLRAELAAFPEDATRMGLHRLTQRAGYTSMDLFQAFMPKTGQSHRVAFCFDHVRSYRTMYGHTVRVKSRVFHSR